MFLRKSNLSLLDVGEAEDTDKINNYLRFKNFII